MAAPAATPLPTTPPTDYTLTTTGEGALLTSYGIGGIASQNVASSYSYSAYSHSTPGSDHTVYVDGNGSSGGSSSGSGVSSGWASLSNTTKYAIYGAAGAAVLILILIIVLVIRRSRRKQRQSVQMRTKGLRNSVRMTQRSSFASPMYAMNDSTLRSNMMPQSPSQQSDLRGPAPMMERMDSSMSFNSMDKTGGAYPPDNRSVHSVNTMYGQQQHAFNQPIQYYPNQGQQENNYPPQRGDARSPTHAQYQHEQQYQGGYSDPQRAMSPTYSQHSPQAGGNSQGHHYQHPHQQRPQYYQQHQPQQNSHYSTTSSHQGYGY